MPARNVKRMKLRVAIADPKVVPISWQIEVDQQYVDLGFDRSIPGMKSCTMTVVFAGDEAALARLGQALTEISV